MVLVTSSSFEPFRELAADLRIGKQVRIVEAHGPAHWPKQLSARVLVNPRVDSPGYPLKLLNYMAAGRAIVSFAGSAKELIHGVDCWMVADGDIDGLTTALAMMLDRPELARELGANARLRVF